MSRRPSPRVRTRDDVASCLDAAVRYGAPGTVGAELELLCVDRTTPLERPDLARVGALLRDAGRLPGGSLVTSEPGGQVELSSAPASGPADSVAALSADLTVVRGALDGDGLALAGLGADPLRPPVRLLRTPRYDCMEAYFAACGTPSAAAGPAMMCSTAAVQVSLDAGTRTGGVQSVTERWQRAHALGPALVAAFACSPLLAGAPTGWRSTRQRIWGDLDPGRTRPPAREHGPVEALADLALSADLMTVRDPEGVCRPAPCGVTFADWMTDGAPTLDDLHYHLTTLFPPVRLRGWLELRYLDMLPDPLWPVCVAVAAVLLDDDRAADAARAACAPVEGRWRDAARLAVADDGLRRAATGCLDAAIEALTRTGATALAAAVSSYAEHFTRRGRCPADDLLDAVSGGLPVAALLTEPLGVAA
ncbi:MAG: ergothioneine biosynthesis glutamate--cysteine ligase EgtA [Mycobacteriales bacterium]